MYGAMNDCLAWVLKTSGCQCLRSTMFGQGAAEGMKGSVTGQVTSSGLQNPISGFLGT